MSSPSRLGGSVSADGVPAEARAQEIVAPRTTLTVAVAQFAPTADKRHNRDEVARLLRQAGAEDADLVVFPEYSSYFEAELGPGFLDNAESFEGPFGTELAGLCRDLGIHAVAGLVEKSEGGRFSNTLVAYDDNGLLVATYRKIHLYDAFGSPESAWVLPGRLDQEPSFSLAGIEVGMQTCYDLRFPEVTRRLVDRGAELVVVPAEWVDGPAKADAWRVLLRARAIENTIYVAAADHPAPVGVGRSMILDPVGDVIAELAEGVGVVSAVVDRAVTEQVRRANPALQLRRFSVAVRRGAGSR